MKGRNMLYIMYLIIVSYQYANMFTLFFRIDHMYNERVGSNIVSIRMIEGKMNLETQIKASTALDCIISNNLSYNNEILEDYKCGSVIKKLFLITLV